ncbi:MAG TPA: DUF305 domain-containing protein, partial [Gemmatimonadales bacterium]|nr:DUF305 domain-containing protein [Gemmatimonadales bacterium]
VAALALAPGRVAGQAPRYTPADVEFMQGMIAHHAQALEMVALVPDRTTTESIRVLAQRIDISQRDEIRLMRSWLTERSQAAPDPAAAPGRHAGGGHDMLMPGMLTADQMARLAAAKGAEFDRLFLQLMIQHHQGALAMVKTLFGTQGAAQETPTFRYASGVDADQRFEIERMQKLLATETRP